MVLYRPPTRPASTGALRQCRSPGAGQVPLGSTLEPHGRPTPTTSAIVMDIFRSVTDRVEQRGRRSRGRLGAIRRCGPPVEIARRLRRTIHERTGLTASVGIRRGQDGGQDRLGALQADGCVVARSTPGRSSPTCRWSGCGAWAGARADPSRGGLATVGDVQDTRCRGCTPWLGVAAGSRLPAAAPRPRPRAP
ncbi:hypothetical protein QJS66_05635 [Kocuria rhizophila]|nr:hypothetical protein QJS66_05635 [Kocuria rhizophila]